MIDLALWECPVKFNSNFGWWYIDRWIFFGVRSLKLPINFFAMALCGVVVWNSAVRSVAGLLCYVDAFGEFGKRLGWIAQKNTVADLTHCIVIGLRRLHTARSNHRLRLLKGQSHLSFRYSRPKSESEYFNRLPVVKAHQLAEMTCSKRIIPATWHALPCTDIQPP